VRRRGRLGREPLRLALGASGGGPLGAELGPPARGRLRAPEGHLCVGPPGAHGLLGRRGRDLLVAAPAPSALSVTAGAALASRGPRACPEVVAGQRPLDLLELVGPEGARPVPARLLQCLACAPFGRHGYAKRVLQKALPRAGTVAETELQSASGNAYGAGEDMRDRASATVLLTPGI
jgi:hypothetical protein